MKNSNIVGPVVALLCLGAGTLSAAEPVVTGATTHATPGDKPATSLPAETCLKDLRAFHQQMQKDGYWLAGSNDAYGYPIGASGYGYGYSMGSYPATVARYPNARPGYEIRTLVAAANILARQGQQQPCEDALSTTRSIFPLAAQAELIDYRELSFSVSQLGWTTYFKTPYHFSFRVIEIASVRRHNSRRRPSEADLCGRLLRKPNRSFWRIASVLELCT